MNKKIVNSSLNFEDSSSCSNRMNIKIIINSFFKFRNAKKCIFLMEILSQDMIIPKMLFCYVLFLYTSDRARFGTRLTFYYYCD